jgi:glucose/arabinose dehydrogenase
MQKRVAFGLVMVLASLGATVGAQKPARAASPPLPPLPVTLFTSEFPVRVTAVATGLSHPWSLAFLPDPSTSLGAGPSTPIGAGRVAMLVTERSGRLRIIRHGVLDPKPVEGVPAVYNGRLAGLLDIALHPKFRENQLLYLSYSKTRADKRSTTVLARAKWTGTAMTDLEEIFVANTWSESETNFGGRIAFDRDGFLFLTVGERQEQNRAQDPGDHSGKTLRLKDDGSVPADNPFVGRAGYMPEIYSLGHRSPQGLTVHPTTGAIWETEHGPLGGDEINIIKPGRN